MTGAITWEMLFGFLALFGAIGSVVKWVHGRFAKIEKSLNDHKLHSAETFATKTGLTESLNRVDNSLSKLSNRFDELMAFLIKNSRD